MASGEAQNSRQGLGDLHVGYSVLEPFSQGREPSTGAAESGKWNPATRAAETIAPCWWVAFIAEEGTGTKLGLRRPHQPLAPWWDDAWSIVDRRS